MKAEKQTESTIILHTESSTNIGKKSWTLRPRFLSQGVAIISYVDTQRRNTEIYGALEKIMTPRPI